MIVTIVLWHYLVVWTKIPEYKVPDPLTVAQAFRERYADLWGSFLLTGEEALGGLLISVVVGISIGLFFAISKWVRLCFWPHFLVFQTVPIVAISSLICIWIGNGMLAVFLIVFLICAPTIIVNTTQGLIAVDQNLLDLFRMGNASTWTILLKLRLPNALPSICTGLRIAGGLAVVGATVGEGFAGGTSVGKGGLGYSLYYAQSTMDTPYTFCLVIVSAIMGYTFVRAIVVLEWLMLRKWHSSYAEQSN